MTYAFCESTLPPEAEIIAAATSALQRCNEYPDDRGLRYALGERYKVPPDHIILGGGSIQVLTGVISTLRGGLLYGEPAFPMYKKIAEACGLPTVVVGLTPGGVQDIEALARLSWRTGISAAIICEPHSPTGTTLGAAALETIIPRFRPTCLIVIDQAYAEFDAGAVSPGDLVSLHPRVLVTRTFSKAYGLAGLRVGYGIASHGATTELRRTEVPFAVSEVGCRAALQALTDTAGLARRIDLAVSARQNLADALGDVGVATSDSVTSFCYVPLRRGSQSVGRLMARNGVEVSVWPEGIRIGAVSAQMNVAAATATRYAIDLVKAEEGQ